MTSIPSPPWGIGMNSFQPPSGVAPLPARTRRREWLGLVLAITLPVGLLVAAAASINHFVNRDWDEATAAADRELAQAVADADRLDPGWRLDELTARRKVLADEDNAAVRVLAANKALPTPWPARPEKGDEGLQGMPGAGAEPATFDEVLRNLPPNVALNDQQTKLLRKELRAVHDALQEARKMADLPNGRYPLSFSPDFYSSLFSAQQQARNIAHLLKLDAALLAQERNPDEALVSVRAALNVARSLGDEPTFISQLIRLGCLQETIYSLERVLAQGEPSTEALAAVQQILEEEDTFPRLLVAARGERAGLNMLMENLESGVVSTDQFLAFVQSSRTNRDEPKPEIALDPITLKTTHAWMLRWLNESVEVAKLPSWDREARIKELNNRVKQDAPPLARLVMPGVQMVAEADRRNQALVRCALAAFAVERYRRENGFWPRSLAALEGKQLAKAPLDPYDGRTLRYRPPPILGFSRSPKDVVIYAVGPDGQDNGGQIDRTAPLKVGTDIGLRLWNISERHKLPPS
jgi:hypothetical protein